MDVMRARRIAPTRGPTMVANKPNSAEHAVEHAGCCQEASTARAAIFIGQVELANRRLSASGRNHVSILVVHECRCSVISPTSWNSASFVIDNRTFTYFVTDRPLLTRVLMERRAEWANTGASRNFGHNCGLVMVTKYCPKCAAVKRGTACK